MIGIRCFLFIFVVPLPSLYLSRCHGCQRREIRNHAGSTSGRVSEVFSRRHEEVTGHLTKIKCRYVWVLARVGKYRMVAETSRNFARRLTTRCRLARYKAFPLFVFTRATYSFHPYLNFRPHPCLLFVPLSLFVPRLLPLSFSFNALCSLNT